MLLLREGEEEENRQAEAAAALPRPKPPSRLFRLVVRSHVLEAEVHLRVFTDYLLRPPLLQVRSHAQTVMSGLLPTPLLGAHAQVGPGGHILAAVGTRGSGLCAL